jgi:hypothetical protein
MMQQQPAEQQKCTPVPPSRSQAVVALQEYHREAHRRGSLAAAQFANLVESTKNCGLHRELHA